MSKNALLRPLALGLSLAPLALASAQSAPPPAYVFTAVDSVELRDSGFTFLVTGLVQGERVARTVELFGGFYASPSYQSPHSAERCERMALLAMNKPGRYLFEVQEESSSGLRCKLTRLP
jgi:hypothetical protein